MKKTYVIFVLTVIAAMLLSACGPQNMPFPEVIKDPTQPGALAGQVETVAYKTTDEAYTGCAASPNGETAVGSVNGVNVNLILCQQIKADSAWLLPMGLAVSAFPGIGDDAAYVAGVTIFEGTKFVLIVVVTLATVVIPANITAYEVKQLQIQSAVAVDAITAEFEAISSAGTIDEALAGSLSWESTKHRDSPMVLAAFHHLQGSNMLKRVGESCQFRCSGSIQIWGGMTPGQARGSVAAVYIAGTKVAFVVVSGNLISAAGMIVPSGMTDFGNGWYMNTMASDSKVEAAFNLGAGRTLGKGYDPANTVTLGEGWASWLFKQEQYNLYIPIAATMIP